MIRLDERYLRLWDERLPAWQAFDPSDPAHVDRAAGVLFEHFSRLGDMEAFALLNELTGPLLDEQARRMLVEQGMRTSPATLVEALRRHLFLGRGRDAATFAERHFLTYARELLGRLVRHTSSLAAKDHTSSDDSYRGTAGGRWNPGEDDSEYK